MNRYTIHALFLLAAPLLVAWWGLSAWGALGLVILLLLWRWAITLSQWVAPARRPRLELESIGASHFAEKARWCLDRLGVEYKETFYAGAWKAFVVGRTVPLLHARTKHTALPLYCVQCSTAAPRKFEFFHDEGGA